MTADPSQLSTLAEGLKLDGSKQQSERPYV
jgi:hypothetical protein